MTSPPDADSPGYPPGLVPLVMLDGVLQPQPLLRLREQAVQQLAEHPDASGWQNALSALDQALAELRRARARAGLRSWEGTSPRTPLVGDQRVIDLSVAARRRLPPPPSPLR